MKIYAIVGQSQQTVVNDAVKYTPMPNEILMRTERPDGDYIAKDDGTWENSAATLDAQKAAKIADFKVLRDTAEIEDIEYNGVMYDYDDKSRERLAIARQALEDAGGGSIVWTTADNQRVELTIVDFAGINAVAAMRSNQLHVKYNELKERVQAAQTQEELDAITWENEDNA